jgi:D-glycero-alpha-D-manno-heptose-7-phosphate kinase
MIISRTPLRVSFFGGGTDIAGYYQSNGGGAVLSTTIEKYFYVVVKKRFDDKIRVSYSSLEMVDRLDDLHHELVRESLRRVGIEKGIEIATMSDIPSEGCGLGSSSSVTVGLLSALHRYKNRDEAAPVLARMACEIEIDILGKPIGKQDQYAAAFGNMNVIRFLPDGQVNVEHLTIDETLKSRLNSNLLLFWTGTTRKAEEILTEQVANIPRRIESLNGMKDMVYEGKEMLAKGYLDDFGRLLHQAWELKKRQATKITNDVVDEVYLRAREAGALGGKLTGAGGGGFLLLYCPRAKQKDVRQALSSLRELPFRFEREGSRVVLDMRTG